MELEAHRLLNAIQAMNKQGFKSIGLFFKALLSSEDSRVYKIAENFIQEWCIPIVSQMLRRSQWGPGKRRTVKGDKLLSSKLGKQLIEIILPVLCTELAAVTAIPFARVSATKVWTSFVGGILLTLIVKWLCN